VLEQGEKMKINDTENAVFDDKGTLHIDGASYIEGLDDYEWFFSIDRSELPKLYAELSNDEVNAEELPDLFIKTIIDREINVARLKEICEFKKIDHHFDCWW
jgi:hypothetical protein